MDAQDDEESGAGSTRWTEDEFVLVSWLDPDSLEALGEDFSTVHRFKAGAFLAVRGLPRQEPIHDARHDGGPDRPAMRVAPPSL